MIDSGNRQHLFRKSSAAEKLDLFQSLLDSKEISVDTALALLSTIRVELEHPKANPSSVYVRYGQLVDILHAQMPEVYDQVANAWRTRRGLLQSEQSVTGKAIVSQPEETPSASEEYTEDFATGYRQVQEPAKSDHQTVHSTEPQEEVSVEVGGKEEEHGEPEMEEPEEADEREGKAEEETKEEPEEIEEDREEEENAENEEEQNEEVEEENEEQENQNEIEEQEEGKENNSEAEETEGEEGESTENEIAEESEVETEETPNESEPEAKSEAESDRMAGEAAEAAAESDHVEIEVEDTETVDEEEPPMEAGE